MLSLVKNDHNMMMCAVSLDCSLLQRWTYCVCDHKPEEDSPSTSETYCKVDYHKMGHVSALSDVEKRNCE